MPIDIEGWVEYSPYKNQGEREEEYSWISWMNIGSIIRFNEEVNWVLFGNPKNFNSSNPEYKPIAKNKGLPNNPGFYLKIDMNEIKEHKNKFGTEGLFGFTHFNFSEIMEIDWQRDYKISIEESDWGKLFELVNKFKDLKKIKAEQIRFIVWYNW